VRRTPFLPKCIFRPQKEGAVTFGKGPKTEQFTEPRTAEHLFRKRTSWKAREDAF